MDVNRTVNLKMFYHQLRLTLFHRNERLIETNSTPNKYILFCNEKSQSYGNPTGSRDLVLDSQTSSPTPFINLSAIKNIFEK